MTRHLHRATGGYVIPTPPEPCIDCGNTMLGQYAFRALPAEERARFTRHHARGRCISCYRKSRGDTAGHQGRWSREDLIYEWEFLASQGYDRREAAQRLHVSYAALCKAIERDARERPVQESEEAA